MGFNLGGLFQNVQRVQVTNPQGQQQPAQGMQGQGTPNMGGGQQPGQGGNGPGSSMQQRQGQGQQGMQGQQGQQSFATLPGTGTGEGGQGTGANDWNSLLDQHKGIWDTSKQDPSQSQDPWSQPLLGSDPAKIREAAMKMDFLSQVPQDILQKATSGDMSAFMQVINHVGQVGLSTALTLSSSAHEAIGSKIGERFKKSLPGEMRGYLVNNQAPSNPALSHPSVRPMLQMAREAIARNNPDLSPQQVQQMAETYLTNMSGAMLQANPEGAQQFQFGQLGQQQETNGAPGQDWLSWMAQ